MIKTEMRPTNVFDTDVVHVGDKIKYSSAIFGTGNDWGYGEIFHISDDASFIWIDYHSEVNEEMDHETMILRKSYMQILLTPEMIVNNSHKIEILS